ncbi:MAG: ABC transporter ATP-binding protein [Spirochaetales bacterium]|nr:ABC transporter ATP-binding protein [Spirochaetales bacterium]
MNLVEIHHLQKSFLSGSEILPVLQDLDFCLEEGKTALITGESGSGKSTFLSILGGLDNCEAGQILVEGRDIAGLGEEKLSVYRRDKIGFIFQFHHLMKDFTALENVFLPLYMTGEKKKRALERAEHWLGEVGLSDRKNHFPAQLSGGERQRVAVARALVKDPALILADEPTGNLDEGNSRQVEDLLFSLVREKQKTLVLVTHDPFLSRRGDRHLHLERGRLTEQ